MSHQVQLSPPSHHPTAVWTRPGTPLSHRSAAAMPVLPRPDMRRILSRPGNPIRPGIVHTPAEDSPAIPGPARQDWSAQSCHGPLAGPIPAKRGARGRRGDLCAPAYVPGHRGQRSASKPRDRARPAGYPAGTCHRPPVDLRRQRPQASPNDPPPGQRPRRCPRPPSSTPAPPSGQPFARHHPAARRRSAGVRPGFRRSSSARSMSRNRRW